MRGRAWTTKEDSWLRKNYAAKGVDESARTLGRARNSIFQRVSKLGISNKGTWSQDELDYLQENFAEAPWEELKDRLRRSKEAIAKRASLMNLARAKKKKQSRKPKLSQAEKEEMAKIRERALQPYRPLHTKEDLLKKEEEIRQASLDYYKRTRCGCTSNRERREAMMRAQYSAEAELDL